MKTTARRQSAVQKLTLRKTTLKNLKTLSVRAGLRAGGSGYPSATTCPRHACPIECAL